SFTSSIGALGMPLRMEQIDRGALWHTRLSIRMRFTVPTLVLSFGPRSRAPRRRKIGPVPRSRMVVLVMATSSSSAPSTDSRAYPKHPSKIQLEMAILMNPPFDSVPHLIRPVPYGRILGSNFLKVPSSIVPNSYHPLTQQLAIVMFLVGRAYPRA